MRFAWMRKQAPEYPPVKLGFLNPRAAVRLLYNAAFWVFVVPFFFTAVAYGSGFIAFVVVIAFRFAANLYVNNALALTPEQHERYPFRI
jgi:hypothetical protein